MLAWPFLAALALAGVNALPHALRRIPPRPRARFLSFCGGVTIAFVLMRLLPALGDEAALIQRLGAILPLSPGENVYAIALLSLLLFYGADMLSQGAAEAAAAEHPAAPAARVRAFRFELASFAALDFLIGFTLLHRARAGGHELLFFFVAMFLKFILSDQALHAQHQVAYDRLGRWVLTVAVLVGWALGATLPLPPLVPPLVEAFIAGGVILNILRWELPRAGGSKYWPFLLGAVAYAALLALL